MTQFREDDGSGFAIEGDAGATDMESMHKGGGNFVSTPGWAHVIITEYEASEPRDDKLRMVTLQVEVLKMQDMQNKDLPDEVGKSCKCRIWVESWADKDTFTKHAGDSPEVKQILTRLKAIWFAAGLISEEQLAAEGKFSFNFANLIDRQCIVQMKKSDDFQKKVDGVPQVDAATGAPIMVEGRVEVQYPGDFYHPKDPAVVDVRVDKEMMGAEGGGSADAAQGI